MRTISHLPNISPTAEEHVSFTLRFWRLVLLLLPILIWPIASYGLESPTVTTPHSTASLITDSDTFDERNPPKIALRIQLKPGWHTYWLNPGDAGDPVRIDLTATGAAHGKSQDIQWPIPQQIREGSLTSNAYLGEVILPINVSLAPNNHRDVRDDPRNLKLKAISSWLVCKDTCIPEYGQFSLTLPKRAFKASAQRPLFTQALAHMPHVAPWSVYVIPPATIIIDKKPLGNKAVTQAHFIPDERGTIVEASQQFLVVDASKVALHLTPSQDFTLDEPLTGLLSLTFSSGETQYFDIEAQPRKDLEIKTEEPPKLPHNTQHQHFLDLILFAFVGGLILNLMPCVFPILAMKIMSLTQLAGKEKSQRQQNALAYSGGTILSFTCLGAIIMLMRYCGIMAGWGIQFQSPIFVGLILWFLFLISLNLLGVYNFNMPAFSPGLHIRNDLINSFVTGILAVIVASPCTAPFMGIAVAGALNAEPVAGLIVFATLGMGLATPFIILNYYPSLIRYLPKPGPWMVYFRKALAFPLLASCAWLLWVATKEGGSVATFYLSLGLIVLGFLSWLCGDFQSCQTRGGNTTLLRSIFGTFTFFGTLCLILFLALLPNPTDIAAEKEFSVNSPDSISFSEDKLKLLHKQGRTVFVDMTAAWCITCIANEHMVLNTDPVRYAFQRNHVVFMQGDWTHRDEAITEFLHEYGHDGVPFYLLVPPKGNPIILPQILTQELVIKLLNAKPEELQAAQNPAP